MPTILFSLFLLFCGIQLSWGQSVYQQIQVELQPERHHISIRSKLKLPAAHTLYTFQLHRDLTIQHSQPAVTLLQSASSNDVPVNIYQVKSDQQAELILHYSGAIFPPDQQEDSASLIGPQGVYLNAHSVWYPQFENSLVNFELSLKLPEGWLGISQGKAITPQHWQDLTPQQEIYLIAAPFTRYQQQHGDFSAEVYLRQADPALAQRYLNVTQQFVNGYSQLLGPYPYPKFALVENFQQTGYGMPSFTLLGSQVIRMPFILHSSYPHEILHNWWGNGVYVDYDSGNWAEGLTSYLADHLIQQQKGQDVLFRRNILQGYRDFVDANRDFALTQFRGRHSNSSEAIGYGKTQMLFHMLRLKLGDELFRTGLQQLYQQQRFQTTRWDDLIRIFSQVSGQPLNDFFAQWLQRVGAPQLALQQTTLQAEGHQWRLRAQLLQQQSDEAYQLTVPFIVAYPDRSERHQISMNQKQTEINLLLAQKPIQLQIDPEFDLFRRLDPAEIPAALSQALGAKQWLMVLPSTSSPAHQQAYQQLATQWAQQLDIQINTVLDQEPISTPRDTVIWLMGWNNRWLTQFSAQTPVDQQQLNLFGQHFKAGQHSVLLSGQFNGSHNTAIWLGVEQVNTIQQLSRKLPHYRKYSYLVFEEGQANNLVKGQWQLDNTPLSHHFDPSQKAPAPSAKPALFQLLNE